MDAREAAGDPQRAGDSGPTGPSQTVDAVVVGGGIAGLVAARDLAAGGLRVVVLEAGGTVGGAVRAHRVAELELDAGAESFATRGGTVAALAGELGLAGAVTVPAPLGAWVQLPSGAGTLPRAGLLGVPANPWAADVRRTIGAAGAVRASVDRVLPRGVGAGPDATFGGLVRTRMGGRVLERLVAPVVGGVHAADPEQLDVRTVAPGLLPALAEHGSLAAAVAALRALAPAGAAVGGLVGGMHTLTGALVADLERHGARVEVGSPVDAVARTGAGWTVRTRTAARGVRLLAAPRLVLAVPSRVALGLLAPVLPELADVRTDPGADVLLVTLVVRTHALDRAPRGTGVLVARAAHERGAHPVRAKALTHATAKWPWLAERAGPGRHVLRLSYGRGPDAPGRASGPVTDLAAMDDDALTATALRDAGTLLGVPLDPSCVVGTARIRWSQSLPQPSATHRAAVDAVRAAVSGVPGLAVCGAWVAGNGLAAVVPQARAAAHAVDAGRTGSGRRC